MNDSFCISRLPVFGVKLDVLGYELTSPSLRRADPDSAGYATFYRSLADSQLDKIVGNQLAFVPFTPELLANDLWKLIPASRVVFSYPDAVLSQSVSDNVADLLSDGYSFVLPHHSSRSDLGGPDSPQHIVRLDVTCFTPDELENHVQMLRKSSVRIMSTRLDTYDDVEFSRSLGVDFYRGRFLWKPVFQHDEIPANRLTIVRALSKLQEPDIPMEELEEIISQDLALSYKVLRWVNSANTGLKANVTSVSHAVRIAGVRRIKSWASAMLLSAIDDKPSELMRGSLIRARMSELLAATLNRKETDSYFTAGLFSALDALLDCPLEQAIKDLPLSPEIQLGLLAGGGPIGQTLDCTLAYERGDWDHVRAYGFDQGVALERIRDCYMDAIGWSEEILEEST